MLMDVDWFVVRLPIGVVLSITQAEVCELVGIYVHNTLANKYDKYNIGNRDNGLAVFKNTSETYFIADFLAEKNVFQSL